MLENLWPHGTHGNRAWATFYLHQTENDLQEGPGTWPRAN